MTEPPMRPQTPSVPPSEPEAERQFAKKAVEKADEEGIKVISLEAASEYLYRYWLHIDENGFIKTEDDEYAVPYVFEENLMEESDEPADNIFNDYFKPLTECPEYTTPDYSEKIHLTDLVTIFTDEDGTPHPVKDDLFIAEKMYKRTGLVYNTVTAWSSVYKRFAFGEGLQELESLRIATYGNDDAPTLKLTCLHPDCDKPKELSLWEGDVNDPECPDCGGRWLESRTECTECGEWHWGTNMSGGGMYAEPICPNCPAGMESLKSITRY